MDLEQARRLLREFGVEKYATSCFCNPNAMCPVCGERVFYYQNEFGSKVFFDQPGAPWQKHPCTDNGQRQRSSLGRMIERPSRRARGISLELLDAYQRVAASGLIGSVIEDEGDEPYWTLIEIKSVTRLGWDNVVVAEFLGTEIEELVSFSFTSDVEVLQSGDLISIGDEEISLFRFDKGESRTYKITKK